MKYFIIIWLFLTSLGYSQVYRWDIADLFDSSALSSTNKDSTSLTSPFMSRDYMKFKATVYDTSGDDSVNLRFRIYTASDYVTDLDWVVQDSFDVATDSTWTEFHYTEFAEDPDPYMFIEVEGLTGNKINSSVLITLKKIFRYQRK